MAQRALAVFAALAEVEGRLHRRPPDQVHFHEVGSHDTIVDVVGTAAALEVLGVDEVTASPVATGTGTVRSAHGFLPNPSPAVVELLRGAPTWGRDLSVELTTPTGAALLAALASRFGPLPPMRIESTRVRRGHEGDRRPAQLHAGRRRAGHSAERRRRRPGGRRCSRPTSTTPPARSSPMPSRRSSRPARYDAWITPVLMKKGRPGHQVSALADPALVDTVRRVLHDETGTLGVRGSTLERWPASRSMETVEVEGMAGAGQGEPRPGEGRATRCRPGGVAHWGCRCGR